MSTTLPGWVRYPHRDWKPLNPEKTYWECTRCGCRRDDALHAKERFDDPVYYPPRPGSLAVSGSPPICKPRRKP